MPLQATSGAASYDAYGGGVAAIPNYIEDVFSTYLWTGNGTLSIPIVNGINLSGKGGMVWMKGRNNVNNNYLYDTVRGVSSGLVSNTTNAAADYQALSAFNSNGFTDSFGFTSSETAASWTFRKQPKFFDVVTYTGNGVSGTQISHNLGSTPGFVVVKNLTNAGSWYCWHTAVPGSGGFLETTDAFSPTYKYICNTVNSTVFSVDSGGASVNGSGNNYVAYLFASNAGGFGLTGTDNVISCGSYVGSNTTSTTVTLGYEPQWVMIKRATGSSSAYTGWAMFDTMRGMPVSGNDRILLANTADAENPPEANGAFVSPTATGFTLNVAGSNLTNTTDTYIYIAIRRGPMKVPTDATKVFSPLALNNSTGTANTTGFPVDLQIQKDRAIGLSAQVVDRLRGVSSTSTAGFPRLYTAQALAENNSGIGINFNNTGFSTGSGWSGQSMVYWNFQRAPGFFDEVCYTGTGSATTFNHNLTVAPEILIVKSRPSASYPWPTLVTAIGGNGFLFLDTTSTTNTASTYFNNTYPTASVFSVGSHVYTNELDTTYVAYLFATCPGVSKVGGYTGNGTTQTINCGFTGGARFVLIKCTNVVGDWYTYDTARGMTTLTDPYLLLNSGAVETATLGSVTTVSTGFALNSTILADINASGNTYIFLAIA